MDGSVIPVRMSKCVRTCSILQLWSETHPSLCGELDGKPSVACVH